MILEDAGRLPDRGDDAELAVGVVVRKQGRAPEEEVVRTPAGDRVELVIHHSDDRVRHALAWLRVGDLGIEVERSMTDHAEMHEQSGDRPGQDERADRVSDPLHRAQRTACYRGRTYATKTSATEGSAIPRTRPPSSSLRRARAASASPSSRSPGPCAAAASARGSALPA